MKLGAAAVAPGVERRNAQPVKVPPVAGRQRQAVGAHDAGN